VPLDPALAGAPHGDTTAVTLDTASGQSAHISNSRRATSRYDQRIEEHAPAGMVRAENIHETTVELAGADGYTRAPLMNFFIERYMTAYQAEVATFVAAASGGPEPYPTGADGLQALVLAEAAVRSNAERRTVDTSEV
jgi:myo-inositol 2-dehydrogenase/D-chiro-inositol 1-dehydrogenase